MNGVRRLFALIRFKPVLDAGCPICHSVGVSRSRRRSALERFGCWLTRTNPYRCGRCGWRWWAAGGEPVNHQRSDDSVDPRRR